MGLFWDPDTSVSEVNSTQVKTEFELWEKAAIVVRWLLENLEGKEAELAMDLAEKKKEYEEEEKDFKEEMERWLKIGRRGKKPCLDDFRWENCTIKTAIGKMAVLHRIKVLNGFPYGNKEAIIGHNQDGAHEYFYFGLLHKKEEVQKVPREIWEKYVTIQYPSHWEG